MPLFVCGNPKCKNIENTATSRYWFGFSDKKKKPLCSACDPKLSGWHNRFPKEKFDPKKHEIINGFVHYKNQQGSN